MKCSRAGQVLLAVLSCALFSAQGAFAQAPSPPKPDPTHIPFVLPKDIAWRRNDSGEWTAPLFGDPSKPGIYGVLIKWEPGHNSMPHMHSTDRYAYVISGNWWVSSSMVYDPATLYPIPAGSYVEDVANQVHWDGARGEPAVLILVGEGPVITKAAPGN